MSDNDRPVDETPGGEREHGPTTLALSAGPVHAVAYLRLIAAFVVFAASLWGASLGPGLMGWVAVTAGILLSFLWVWLFLRARKRVRMAQDHYLRLGKTGFEVVSGENRERVAWTDISHLEVDEERLTVKVEREDDKPLHIEPDYGDLSVYELRDALQDARRSGSV